MKRLYVYRIVSILFILLSLFEIYKYNTKECLEINEIVNKNYVFLGDSITDFYDLDNYFDNKYSIVNSGMNGNRVDDILKNMNDRVYRYNPSDVIILIGINDILYKNSSTDEVTKKIEKITKQIKKHNPYCNIYIQSIYPTNDKWKKEHNDSVPDESILKEKILKINKNIKKYCKENKITYINVHDSLVNKDGYLDNKYTNDGLHPNEKGYEIITKIIKKEVLGEKKNN